MNNSVRRDNIVSIGGTALIVGFYLLVIYLPGERACQAARHEIMQANLTIDGIPQRMLQAAKQQKHLRDREASVRQLNRLLDDENELHGVLQKVADLARASGLHVERIQPQAATMRAAYRVVPFQMVVSGNFHRITSLLTGLESQPTLFAVDRLSLKSENEQTGEPLRADITFSVYVKRVSFAGFAEKSDRPTQTQADDSY
jgi:type IV pilus assembly protein PilO